MENIDYDAMKKVAVLFTASMNSGTPMETRVRFALTIPEAQTFCSDERTAAKNHSWAFFYTSVYNFFDLDQEYNRKPPLVMNTRRMKDDGRFDALLVELGCVKIPLSQFKARFEPLGVTVK